MRPRSLAVLLAVVLALGAFIWFYERELPGSEEREEMAGRALPGLLADEVRAVTFERPGEEAVLLVRTEPAVPGAAAEGGAAEDGAGSEAADSEPSDSESAGTAPSDSEPLWRYAAPARFAGARADGQVVADLLSALAALDRTRSLDEVDPASVGLAPPRLLLTLELAGGERRVLAVGGEVPGSTDLVMARGGAEGGAIEEAFLVDRSIWTDLDRGAGDWRSRQVFPGRREQIERVALALAGADGGAEVVLERRATGAFWIAEPVGDLADAKAVDALLDALTGLRVNRFLDAADEDPAALGLAPPRGVVTVAMAGGGEPFRLELGGPAPEGGGSVLRAGTTRFVADTPLERSLLQAPAEWQSRHLTERQIFEVEAIEVRGGGAAGAETVARGETAVGGALRLERQGTDWRRGGEVIPYSPVADLLFSLIEARAERLEPAAALGLGEPDRVIRLTTTPQIGSPQSGSQESGSPQGAGPEVVEEIALHASRDGLVPATVEGRPWALLLPPAAVEEIHRNLARVRDARPAVAGDAPAEAGAAP